MTTVSWNTVVDQSTDAAFRVWGSELNTKFAAAGMVNTTDTGQINWTTVTRAGANSSAGYEIWKLSSGNLYFKIEYGSGSTNTRPAFWITVGTGSNGSGTLTGQLSARTQLGSNTIPLSAVTNYQSYLCATANYFGLAWKIGSAIASQAYLFLTVMQTVDSTGAATTVGYFVYASTATTTDYHQCVATTAAVTGAACATPTHYLIPNNTANPPASSTDGAGNNQVFLWWFSILGTSPIAPLLHVANILAADLTLGSTASMTLVGTTAHTYINATQEYPTDIAGQITRANLAKVMLWE